MSSYAKRKLLFWSVDRRCSIGVWVSVMTVYGLFGFSVHIHHVWGAVSGNLCWGSARLVLYMWGAARLIKPSFASPILQESCFFYLFRSLSWCAWCLVTDSGMVPSELDVRVAVCINLNLQLRIFLEAACAKRFVGNKHSHCEKI